MTIQFWDAKLSLKICKIAICYLACYFLNTKLLSASYHTKTLRTLTLLINYQEIFEVNEDDNLSPIWITKEIEQVKH